MQGHTQYTTRGITVLAQPAVYSGANSRDCKTFIHSSDTRGRPQGLEDAMWLFKNEEQGLPSSLHADCFITQLSPWPCKSTSHKPCFLLNISTSILVTGPFHCESSKEGPPKV